tara:strand:- start:533 stop:670 length:138 start_codon:yes stop_codon:yes gene_type:complete
MPGHYGNGKNGMNGKKKKVAKKAGAKFSATPFGKKVMAKNKMKKK